MRDKNDKPSTLRASNIKFHSTEMNLPIIWLSRSRLKYNCPESVRNFFTKKRFTYERHYNIEHDNVATTRQKARHMFGLESRQKAACANRQSKSVSRDLISVKPWQLPSNLYRIRSISYASRKDAGSAHWPKFHKTKSKTTTAHNIKPPWKFHSFPNDIDRSGRSCQKYRGLFMSNARDRKTTTRSMVSNFLTCYHNPKKTSITKFYPKRYQLAHKFSNRIKMPLPNMHIFYPGSTVPVREIPSSKSRKNVAPRPRRFEMPLLNVCPCLRKLINQPNIQMISDRVKHNYRRLPYKTISTRLYYSPELNHVNGKGHRHIFWGTKRARLKLSKNSIKKSNIQLQLYPDSNCNNLIKNPTFNSVSLRQKKVSDLKFAMHYNSVVKHTKRKQLRNNKIAFMSCQERFKDAERTPLLNVSEMSKAIERRLRGPPMPASTKDVRPKLYKTPKHMQSTHESASRKLKL